MPLAHIPSKHILFTDNECRAGGGITIGSEGKVFLFAKVLSRIWFFVFGEAPFYFICYLILFSGSNIGFYYRVP
jgi:hypothetical protein